MQPEEILVYLSLVVSIAVLFFIIWDHIKYGRILASVVFDDLLGFVKPLNEKSKSI